MGSFHVPGKFSKCYIWHMCRRFAKPALYDLPFLKVCQSSHNTTILLGYTISTLRS